MKVLVVHPFFPGCFGGRIDWLLQQGHDVVAIRTQPGPPYLGLKILTALGSSDAGDQDSTHPWSRRFDSGCRSAEATAVAALKLKEEGWTPDLIWGHPSWGDLLLIKDIFPSTPVLFFAEYYLRPNGPGRNFDPEFPINTIADVGLARTARAQQLLCLEDLDAPYVSTRHAVTTFPDQYRDRIRVLHEGVATNYFRRQDRKSSIELLNKAGAKLPLDATYLTYLARGFEPLRGFHSFMRSAVQLQKLRPEAHIVCMGGDLVHYGREHESGRPWREVLLAELDGQLDLNRLHWLPWSNRSAVRALYSISDCHVYLTAPDVQLSLSPLEAMACGAVVVSNPVEAVTEVIEDEVTGRYVDFFNYLDAAQVYSDVLTDPGAFNKLGKAARELILDRYDLLRTSLDWKKAIAALVL